MYTSLLPLLLCASSAVAQTFANTTFANATICSQTDDGFASVINNTSVTVDCNLAAQTCRNYIGSNNAYWTSRLSASPHRAPFTLVKLTQSQLSAMPATEPIHAVIPHRMRTTPSVQPRDVSVLHRVHHSYTHNGH